MNYNLHCRQLLQFPLLILAMVIISGCYPIIFTGAAGSMVEFAKDRSAGDTITDIRIATAIKAEFMRNNFSRLYTRIKIEVVEGRVLYTGVVDKEEEIIKAVQIAWNQKNVKEVINELKADESSRNFNLIQYTRDTMITSQIKSKTLINPEIKFSNYTVITLNDVVYLFGIARSEAELEKVADIAAKTRGVKKVISHVKIQPVLDNINQLKNSNASVDNIDNIVSDKPASFYRQSDTGSSRQKHNPDNKWSDSNW